MSAASSATVRRTAAPAPSRPAAPQAAAQPRPALQAAGFAFVDGEDEIRINLGDIPLQKASMEIEGFKPTLLSRLFNIVSPLK